MPKKEILPPNAEPLAATLQIVLERRENAISG